MHGQKSCKHRFEEKVKTLGSHGYYLKCRCGKYQSMRGMYPKGESHGGRPPMKKESDDRHPEHPEA